MDTFEPPTYRASSFHCPHCGRLAPQTWTKLIIGQYESRLPSGKVDNSRFFVRNAEFAKCTFCNDISFWVEGAKVYPIGGNVEQPNSDLPEAILKIYREARSIVGISPRGAAALIRLAIQNLCNHLLRRDESNLNKAIGDLVKIGLPVTVQQALDSVRVIGNNAVHPGTIDLNDKPETAAALFKLTNIICDHLITQPRLTEEIFNTLPDGAKTSITKRDGGSSAKPPGPQ